MEITDKTAPDIRLTLRFYSIVADMVGHGQQSVSIAAGAALGDLADALARRYPDLADYIGRGGPRSSPPLRWVVNGHMAADMGEPLSDGDEIRVFPVISGG